MSNNPMQGKQGWFFLGAAVLALLAALLAVMGLRKAQKRDGGLRS
jgi:cytochrome c-type biogenesis protein CcmH/NrfG